MAKILYGVCGEGMGHAIRSQVFMNYLQSKGHQIVVLASHKAYDFLKDIFEKVYKIHGFQIEYDNNEVKSFSSFIQNTANLPTGVPASIKQISEIIKDFNPEICITDFEPYTSYTAQMNKIPCISLDNNSILNKVNIENDKYKSNTLLSQTVAKFMVPYADISYIMSFFYPNINEDDVVLIPPVIRNDIIESKKKAEMENNKHILVYQTSKSNKTLFNILKGINENFVIYGFDKSENDKNLYYKPFSTKTMIDDLIHAKGVITNGGFTLITEALYLQKPLLCEPIKNQFEQYINAYYIDRLKIGLFTEKIEMKNIIDFIENLDIYKSRLKLLRFDDNTEVFEMINIKINELIKNYKNE